MARKTIEVSKVLEAMNACLAAPNSTPDGREAIACMLESFLMETGNYGGYRYLEQEHHEDGTLKTLGCGTRREYFNKRQRKISQ
jgi:hypothetical protein